MGMGRGDSTHVEWARLKLHLPKSEKHGSRWVSHRRVAVATRFDKRAYVFHGTVTLASIRLWLRP